MALQEILLKLCDKQKETAPGFLSRATVDIQYMYQLIQKQPAVSIKTSRFFMTSPSPSDITCSLLISLDVCHRAVPVAKCFNSHQIIAAVTCLPGLVEVGERRHYICQRTEVTLRWVILLNGKQSFSGMFHQYRSLNMFVLPCLLPERKTRRELVNVTQI